VDRRAVAAIAALDDDVRGALYACVRHAAGPVTREEAAQSVGISRKLAAFHLDKLVDAGLLATSTEPRGPHRVGRAPKLYQPAAEPVAVCVPPRDLGLLARVLLDALVSKTGAESGTAAAARVAEERGRQRGADERERLRPGRLGAERAVTIATRVLEEQGFEPHRTAGTVRLRNCPFHPLAAEQPEVVCGLNHGFVHGLLTGLQAEQVVEPVLAPRPGECCVELRPRHPDGDTLA
jgi:predicted ArsR family transcriptional regulator